MKTGKIGAIGAIKSGFTVNKKISLEQKMSGLNADEIRGEFAKMDEWSKALVFDANCKVIAEMNCAVPENEVSALPKAYEGRDQAIGPGLTVNGVRYEVHRFHPPLIYGRTGNCDVGEGVSIARGKDKNGNVVYLLICYELPIISARAVPQQIEFFNKHLGVLDSFTDNK